MDLTVSFCPIRVQFLCPTKPAASFLLCWISAQIFKPSHWIPIASSHVLQLRIWIVIYVKYEHPGCIWSILFNFPYGKGGLHCTQWHTSKHKNKFVCLEAAGLSGYEMRTPLIWLLVLMMSSQFLHTKPTLAGVFTVKSGRKVSPKSPKSRFLPLWCGGDTVGRRAGASASSLLCVSGTWYSQGNAWRTQSGHNST